MKLEEIKTRLEKTRENIAKKEKLIEKRETQITKKKKEINALGYEVYSSNEAIDLRDKGLAPNNWDELYWLICDLEQYEDSIKNSQKEIKELKELEVKYSNMYEVEQQKENAIDNLPEIFKTFREFLVNSWDEFDLARRDNLKAKYRELPYKEFIRIYGYSALDNKDLTDEQIHKENEKNSRNIILDLIDRVSSITGEITDFSGLSVRPDNSGFAILNGIVRGKQGIAEVDSIYAGGYNIQKLHVRVLVKRR